VRVRVSIGSVMDPESELVLGSGLGLGLGLGLGGGLLLSHCELLTKRHCLGLNAASFRDL